MTNDKLKESAQKMFNAGYCLQSLRDEYFANQGPLRNIALADFKKIERELEDIASEEFGYENNEH